MSKPLSNEWYYEQIVKDANENPSNRTFTISHVPPEQRSAVIKLLRESYGGNERDKKLGEFAQKVATAIPVSAATIYTLPSVTQVIKTAVTNPLTRKAIKDMGISTLGGETVNEGVRVYGNNKYSSFGDLLYKKAGLKEDTFYEPTVKFILEGANPGLYSSVLGRGLGKGVAKISEVVEPSVKKVVDSSTPLRKIRYKVNDYLDGIEDLKNHITHKTKAGSTYLDAWKEGAEKTISGNKTVYTKGNYILTESPGRTTFTDNNTFRIGNFTDNSYYVTVTPPPGAEKAPLSTVKTVYNVVSNGTPGTYFVADPTSMPKGLIWKDMYDNKNYTGLLKNMLGLDEKFELALSGFSTDALKYINSFRKSPQIATRYNPAPMTSFNDLGQDAVGKALRAKIMSADIASHPYRKEQMLKQINEQLMELGADPAYLQHGIVSMPQPSLMVKYPASTEMPTPELFAELRLK